MRRRKLVIALGAAAVFGAAAVPASAELRRVAVTLVTGQTVEVTVDVPPGTSVQSVALPEPAGARRLGRRPRPGGARRDGHAHAHRDRHADARRPRPPRPNVGAGARAPRARARRTKQHAGRAGQGAAQAREAEPADGNTAGRQRAASSPRPTSGPTDAPTTPATPRRSAPDGSPTLENPTVSVATPGPAPHRRAQLLHREVPHPALPAPDLPGRRRSSTACAGRSWPRSTRSRPTTAATSTSPRPARSAGCSSCPSTWEMYGVDGNQDGKQDPYNPVDAIFAAARYLQGGRRRPGPARGDLRLQPRRLVRRLRAPARAADRRPARPTSWARSPGLTQGRFPVAAKATYAKEVTRRDLKAARERRQRRATSSTRNGQRNGIQIFSRAGAPGRRGQRRPDRARRAQPRASAAS